MGAAAGMTVPTMPAQAPAFHPQLKGAKLGSIVCGRRYVIVSSIAPGLTLATRMVMDVGSGQLAW